MTAATTAAAPSTAAPEMAAFAAFFAAQPGKWQSRRTYHYLADDAVETSETTFDVAALPADAVRRVLAANGVAAGGAGGAAAAAAGATGFTVSFLTRMAAGLVKNSTNLVFVPTAVAAATGTVSGRYYRDRGYEEAGAVGADFEFRPAEGGGGELRMTTWYARVVSVDSIPRRSPPLFSAPRPTPRPTLTHPVSLKASLPSHLPCPPLSPFGFSH